MPNSPISPVARPCAVGSSVFMHRASSRAPPSFPTGVLAPSTATILSCDITAVFLFEDEVQTEENASECDFRGSSDNLPCAAQPSENRGIQKRAEGCLVWPFATRTSRPGGFAEEGYLPLGKPLPDLGQKPRPLTTPLIRPATSRTPR